MKDVAFLEYAFMFNPNETWTHLHQFESDLADYFKTLGLEAEIVNSANGQPGKRIMLLKKIEMVGSVPVSGTKATTQPVKKQMDKLRQK